MNTAEQKVTVAAFTGRIDDPSSHFRLRQYFQPLTEKGFKFHDFSHPCNAGCWHLGFFKLVPYLQAIPESRKYDITWLSRTLVRGGQTIEWMLKRPCVLDVDDAIWLHNSFCSATIANLARHVDVVVVGNTFLADWFGRHNKNIKIVPTAIDTERYVVRSEKRNTEHFVIGWTGTSSNFRYLDGIEKPLANFLTDHRDVMLKIVADRPWQSSMIPPERIIFTQWSRDIEVESLHEMTVGIMPLEDSDWSRGKCSFKMLQYMAVGLPVIVSPVGMNRDILQMGNIGFAAETDNQWREALYELYKQRSNLYNLGLTGRKKVEASFATNIIGDKLLEIFKSMV